MEPQHDYYKVLGVERDTDARTIKRAFLRKARELHPDVNKAPDAEERFKEVNEAYGVLSDEQKRSNYDRFGTPDGPAGFGGDYVDMSDIFGGGFGIDDIFSSFFGGAASGASAQRSRGRDMGISLRISLEEAAAGCTKTISYDRLAPCDDCAGSGVAEGGHESTCTRCNGSGRIVEVQRTIFGQMQSQTTCPVCGGSGKVIDHPCETCNGQGRTPVKETVELTIPAGIHSGQSVRIEGKGEAGIRGEASGALVARIDILQHERFERQGDDLFCRVEIDSFQAILGTSIQIDGIMKDEQLTIEVPAGCQVGQQIMLENCGMPRMGTSARGRLVGVIDIITPTNLAEHELSILRDLVAERSKKS